MGKWYSLLIMIAVVLASTPALSTTTDPTSCITCHTDGEKMKSLVVPPKIHAEGEG